MVQEGREAISDAHQRRATSSDGEGDEGRVISSFLQRKPLCATTGEFWLVEISQA
jgi:hypothetical protein